MFAYKDAEKGKNKMTRENKKDRVVEKFWKLYPVQCISRKVDWLVRKMFIGHKGILPKERNTSYCYHPIPQFTFLSPHSKLCWIVLVYFNKKSTTTMVFLSFQNMRFSVDLELRNASIYLIVVLLKLFLLYIKEFCLKFIIGCRFFTTNYYYSLDT